MRLRGGRAFTSCLLDASPTVGEQFFLAHVMFGSQRLRSNAVPASVDPAFDDTFVLDLEPPGSTGVADLSALLKFSRSVNIVLCRVCHPKLDGSGGEGSGGVGAGGSVRVDLLSTVELEWRVALLRGEASLALELTGVGDEAKMGVPVGVLHVELAITPSHGGVVPFAQHDVTKQIRDELEAATEAKRKFFAYAKTWWAEYRAIHTSFQHRLVKVFAEDETCAHRSVCAFVTPITAGRLLPSARHAARFVSLIPYHRTEVVGSVERVEAWHAPHTFLSMRQGDCEDHATLLCSLLLGFGLDAYVVVGTRVDKRGVDGDHVWVMTRDGDAGVTFWESLTGQRVAPSVATPSGHRFLRVGSVFNHKQLFANKQVSDLVEGCVFTLEDDRLWKCMEARVVEAVPHVQVVPLLPPTLAPFPIADTLQQEIRSHVSAYRESIGLGGALALFDPTLEHLLQPALTFYEMERLANSPIPNLDFYQSIKNTVPPGHTFKAFPVVFNHMSASKMMATLQSAKVAREILDARGDHLRFAVQVAVHPFPDDFVAVWVMLAAVYAPFQ